MNYTIKESKDWLWEIRGIWVQIQYLQKLCSSNRLKSIVVGNMRFINVADLEKFEFRKPGRPKNEKN